MRVSDEILLALLEGTLPLAEEEALAERLENDESLRQRLAGLSGGVFPAQELAENLKNPPEIPEEVVASTVRKVMELSVAGKSSAPSGNPESSPGTRSRDEDEPSDPSPAPRPVPECLGKFTGIEHLADGGMGTVFRAVDPGLERAVAIKRLHPAAAADATTRERFQREARALAGIQHPHVLPVHQVSENDMVPWFVMPLAKGGSLQERLDRHPGEALPVPEIVELAKALAGALEAVHAQGRVHRDVKPSNILLGAEPGEIWLSDFGLVKEEMHPGLTRSRTFVGTPQFMSPEQAAGTETDARSDLFSLGAVLYTLAAGCPPFGEENFEQLRRKVREDPPPPLREAAPDLPRWLRHLIEALLAKQPEHRPASVGEVLSLLEAGMDRGSVPGWRLHGPEARRRRLRRIAVRCAATLLAPAIAAFVCLEQSGRTHMVNRLLATRSGDPIWLSGNWGTYASLGDAVAAANQHPGPDEIVLFTDATLLVTRLEVTQPLSLRAARRRSPMLLARESAALMPDQAHVSVRAPLRLRGLTLKQRLGIRQGRPVFRVRGTSLTLQRCRIVRSSRSGTAADSLEPAVIAGGGTARIRLDRCETFASGSPLLGMTGRGGAEPDRTRARVERSRVFGLLLQMSGAPVAGRLRVGQSVLVGKSFIDNHARNSTLQAEVSNSALHSSRAFVRARWETRDSALDWLTWRGENNLIHRLGSWAITSESRIDDFREWENMVVRQGGTVRSPKFLEDPIVPSERIGDARLFAGESYPVEDPKARFGIDSPRLVPPDEIGPPSKRRAGEK